MTARDALVDRAKKAGDVSRYQMHVYIGANDYLYEQVRSVSLPDTTQLQDFQGKVQTRIGQLTDDGVEPLRRVIRTYSPAKVRESVRGTLQERAEAAKSRRAEFAKRGETIVGDWTKAVAVQDANELISSVRGADNPAELAKSLKTWFAEFPPAAAKPAKPAAKAARKTATARKTTARKTTARKTAARKTATATPVAAGTPAATASTQSSPSTD
jgi:hypothetical protein